MPSTLQNRLILVKVSTLMLATDFDLRSNDDYECEQIVLKTFL